MPRVNGLSVQQELVIRGVERPIIFLSGRGTVPEIVEAMKAGAVDFLPKPFKDHELLNAIKVAEERDSVRLQRAAEREAITKLIDKLTPREQESWSWLFEAISPPCWVRPKGRLRSIAGA
jgi:FixJ family two-component response regulator